MRLIKYDPIILLFFLHGCAIPFENMVFETYRTGGLGYSSINTKGWYIVEIWEHQHSSGDLHNYETHTPELRAKAVSILLAAKEHCKNVNVDHEEPFDYQGPPTWSHGRWWRMLVRCDY